MSRHAPRTRCFGGSSHPADPLIAEIASGPSAPSLPEPPPADDARESDDLEALDQHLLAALEADDGEAAECDDGEYRASALQLLRAVRLPTMRALRTASLRTLRAVIARTTEGENPQRWAACHLILGTALRLRAYRAHGHRRAHLFIGAARAFDVAFGVYAALRAGMLDPPNAAPEPTAQREAARCDTNRCGPAYRPLGACVDERDGTTLVAQVIAAGPLGENRHLLERAIAYLRLSRSSADIKSWAWVSSTNNLACALTLLGSRTPAPSGAAMLREAAHVLHEALQVQATGCRRAERASTLINLAETLLSIAERETPHVRLRRMERALAASVAALLAVAPSEWAWVLRSERTGLA